LAKISDLSKLAATYMQIVKDWTGVCADCGAIFHMHDSYRRKTPLFGVLFLIKRVYCPGCGKTHALIPCFVFPYSQVMAGIKEKAIRGICYETHTIEQLAELCAVEPATIKRWWECFNEASDNLANWLAEELASSTRVIDWLGGNCVSKRKKGRKLFSLFGLYRSTYHPDFIHGDFDLLCLKKPLVFSSSLRQRFRC
jgi:bacterioferritin-associated ferredoxin